jgi:hypothetical protein
MPSLDLRKVPLALVTVLVAVLLLAGFIVWGRGMSVQAQHSGSVAAPAEVDRGLQADDSTDVHAFDEFSSSVRTLVYDKNFDRLDQLADSIRSSKAKFSGGMWKLHAFYEGAAQPEGHATEEDWKALETLLNDWIEAKPQSITAQLVLANFYINYAWDARGSGYSDSVSDSGWKLFASRTARAQEILEKAQALPAKCPEWFRLMQAVAQAQGWSKEQAKALLEKAIAFEPDYYYYYQMYATFVSPQWNGEPEESELFAQESADRVGGSRGEILYFRIASFLISNSNGQISRNLSLARIEKGYAESEKLDGFSLSNLNGFAFDAARFGDAIMANDLIPRIGDSWSEDTWGSLESFESARRWAAGAGPAMAQTKEIAIQADANMKTAEGMRLAAEFKKKYPAIVEGCFPSSDLALSPPDIFMEIGSDGVIGKVRVRGMNVAIPCLPNLPKKTVSAPSKVSFWIKLTRDSVPTSAKSQE